MGLSVLHLLLFPAWLPAFEGAVTARPTARPPWRLCADDEAVFVQLSASSNGNGVLKPFMELLPNATFPTAAPAATVPPIEDVHAADLSGVDAGLNQTWEVVQHLLTMNFTQRRKCSLHTNAAEAASLPAYVMDNSLLRHASKGITYRFSKLSKDRDSRAIAFWGSIVHGVDEGDGWLRVGDCYLPMLVSGKKVIFKAGNDRVRPESLVPVPASRDGGAGADSGMLPMSNIRAIEAKGTPGGTRFTILTGEGESNGTNWTESAAYNVDINGSLGNISNYGDAILEALQGQMGLKLNMNMNTSSPSSKVYATMFRTVNGSHIFIPTGSIIFAKDKQIPVWEIKQAIADAVQEGIKKAEEIAKKNNTVPSMEAVRRAVQAEVWGTWNRLAKTMKATRYKRRDRRSGHRVGIAVFFQSVPIFDWCLVAVAILLFCAQHWGLLHWPHTRAFHGTALVLWFILAGLYSVLIFKRQGSTEGILWLNGYILELVFLLENVLVTHIVIQAFRTPRWVNEKALFIVVIARIIFQMIFYMGLAELVFSGEALPYILGLWLLYIAWQAALDDDDSNFDIMDARVVHLARAAFGERLWLSKDDTGALFVSKDNKLRMSLVGLMVFCLILVDALLHVDVALTKIEELQGNGYLCFSSAAVASFCLPELVFVIRDLFRVFPGLKYGISATIVYISVQMLLHAIFRPPVFADLAVFIGCLVCSAMLPYLGILPRQVRGKVDAGTQACLAPTGKEGDFPDCVGVGTSTEIRR